MDDTMRKSGRGSSSYKTIMKYGDKHLQSMAEEDVKYSEQYHKLEDHHNGNGNYW